MKNMHSQISRADWAIIIFILEENVSFAEAINLSVCLVFFIQDVLNQLAYLNLFVDLLEKNSPITI